jgi:hypothetical protein
MTDCKHICRFCKHWGGKYFAVDSLLLPVNRGGHGWTNAKEAREYIIERRNTESMEWECDIIENHLEINIDQGSGWDSGGASVESININGDFGCIHWVHWEST